MADVNQVIKRCIDDIWPEYDPENKEILNEQDCKRFIIQTLKEFKGVDELDYFSDEEFD